METTKGLYGIIQKNAPKVQVVVTTGPPQCTKLGPSLGTHVGTQAVSTFLEQDVLFYG